MSPPRLRGIRRKIIRKKTDRSGQVLGKYVSTWLKKQYLPSTPAWGRSILDNPPAKRRRTGIPTRNLGVPGLSRNTSVHRDRSDILLTGSTWNSWRTYQSDEETMSEPTSNPSGLDPNPVLEMLSQLHQEIQVMSRRMHTLEEQQNQQPMSVIRAQRETDSPTSTEDTEDRLLLIRPSFTYREGLHYDRYLPESFRGTPTWLHHCFPPPCWPRSPANLTAMQIWSQITASQKLTSDDHSCMAKMDPLTADVVLSHILECQAQAKDREAHQVPESFLEFPVETLIMYLKGYFREVDEAITVSLPERVRLRLLRKFRVVRQSWMSAHRGAGDIPPGATSNPKDPQGSDGPMSEPMTPGLESEKTFAPTTAEKASQDRSPTRAKGLMEAEEDEILEAETKILESGNVPQSQLFSLLVSLYRGQPSETNDLGGKIMEGITKRIPDNIKFGGKADADIRPMIHSLESVVKSTQLSRKDLLGVVPYFLKDEANHIFWSRIKPQARNSFILAMAMLLRQYHGNARSRILGRRFDNARYNSKEDADYPSYAHRLLALAPDGVSESELVRHFMRTIPSGIRFAIETSGGAGPSTLMEAAAEAEAQQRAINEEARRRERFGPITRGRTQKPKEDRMGLHYLGDIAEALVAETTHYGIEKSSDEEETAQLQEVYFNAIGEKKVVCYTCGGPHFQRVCPKRGSKTKGIELAAPGTGEKETVNKSV
jgi:hypothetical protein